MPTIEYFQIPADDINRAQELYKKVFGWEMQKWNNPEKPEQRGTGSFKHKTKKEIEV